MPDALARHWRPPQRISRHDWPRALSHWLLDTGSLTQLLVRACGSQFSVALISQHRARPRRDEALALNLANGRHVQVREVKLRCGEQVWVVARTVIPLPDLRGPARRLTRLGTKPLGAALFATRGMRREPLQVARIHARALPRLLAADAAPQWGRRSLFRLGRCRVLVHEIFTPDIGPSPGRARRHT